MEVRNATLAELKEGDELLHPLPDVDNPVVASREQLESGDVKVVMEDESEMQGPPDSAVVVVESSE